MSGVMEPLEFVQLVKIFMVEVFSFVLNNLYFPIKKKYYYYYYHYLKIWGSLNSWFVIGENLGFFLIPCKVF